MSYIREELKGELEEGFVRGSTSEFINFIKGIIVNQLAKETGFENNIIVKTYIAKFLETQLGKGALSFALAGLMPIVTKFLPENLREYSNILGKELRVKGFENIMQPAIRVLRKPVENFISQQLGLTSGLDNQKNIRVDVSENNQEHELENVVSMAAKAATR